MTKIFMSRSKSQTLNLAAVAVLVLSNGLSFFAGTLFALSAGLDKCAQGSSPQVPLGNNNEVLLRVLKDATAGKSGNSDCDPNSSNSMNSQSLFPPEVRKFAVGMMHTPKEDFVNHFDLGPPIDTPKEGDENILLLYSRRGAMPTSKQSTDATSIELVSTDDAIENCDYMNVILTHHDGQRNQCLAIVPQYESYHIQKYMRVPPSGKRSLDSKYPLMPVSRGHQSNGREQFLPPKEVDTYRHWDMLRQYLNSLDDVLEELKPIVKKITVENTVVVMVCNFGQSELLLNFACSARARGFDISNVLVFATDEETKELAESVGMTSYFDHRNFGDIPKEAAARYGDRKFVAMMMAKVVCVQLIGLLGVDVLFQDVDIVWFKNPLDFFHDETSPIYGFDAYFQDDGAHSVRYAPWSSNSGFYYLRHNDRTQYFLNQLLMAGDLILKTDSHQQALVAVLSEHANLYGLRVKVLSRDDDGFPGGYHFHQKSGAFMKAFFAKEKQPYIFHMSWTTNKDNKLLFFRQMGEWYLQDQCIQKKTSEIELQNNDFVESCCSAAPLFSCHYKDKPSIKPCKDSPTIDKRGKSFW